MTQSTHRRILPSVWLTALLTALLTACSTTSGVPDGDRLFTGLKEIVYEDDPANQAEPVAEAHLESTMEEVEAALATQPNGAIFGSSYYRSPVQFGLRTWNAFHNSKSGIGKWLTKNFGSPPVLMSQVNPTLRAKVAESVLHSHGYMHGSVTSQEVLQKNPKKGKLNYYVNAGRLTTLDSISYTGFPAVADSLIRKSQADSYLQRGNAFTVASLDQERQRIATLLRNHGYYFFQPTYISYLADTIQTPAKAQLRVALADSLPAQVTSRWTIGRIAMNIRRSYMEQPTDSFVGRRFTVTWNGKKPILRPRVIMGNMRLRPGQQFSYDRYQRTVSNINQMGLFSMVNYRFTPRTDCDTLDLSMICTMDKPYDFYVETSFVNRTIGRYGPQAKIGLTRRNAFRGGEKLDINVHGSYEWQGRTSGTSMNSYEYGADLSIEFPRLVAPFFGGNNPRVTEERFRQARLQGGKLPNIITARSTKATLNLNIVQRPGFYKMNVVGAEWTYRWKTLRAGSHEFSPLTMKYQFMNDYTEAFQKILDENLYLLTTMTDHFIPQMRYTYVYTSPKRLQNPIRWETTISEAGNLTSLYFLARGRKWNEKNKEMFKTAYSQFVKLETDFTKTWRQSARSNIVAHVNAGIIYSYGNSDATPFSEMFYIGGANSVRALPVHGAGPGGVFLSNATSQERYLVANGDLKLLANLEWRQRVMGGLWAAVFLDAGNVWMHDDYMEIAEFKFKLKDFWKQMAVGTGIGLRYDLDFLVLRLDWGVGLHLPYDTGKSGFYNIDSFKDNNTLHFAIGYPF